MKGRLVRSRATSPQQQSILADPFRLSPPSTPVPRPRLSAASSSIGIPSAANGLARFRVSLSSRSMALRGRGRGGGGGGGRGGASDLDRIKYPPDKMKPHEDFPDTTLPGKTCLYAETKEETTLRESTEKFDEFWRRSCYHLYEDAPKKKNEDKEVERFSELVQGSKRGQLGNKKLRWDRDSDKQAFEVFEKLEQTHKDGDKNAEKKIDDDGDEQEEEEVEVERDENSDDDYNQNIEFDDDHDDWNQEEETHEDYYS